jgi:hypothetical protein
MSAKPVPILQYLDHFGRAGSTDERPAPRALATIPFKPRSLVAVSEPAPRLASALGRVLRDVAAPRGEAAPQQRARAVPTEAEMGARIADAFERGRAEGAAAARLEEAEAVAQVMAEERERSMESQLDFQLNEYAQIADQISAGLQDIEQRIAQAATRILAPLLAAETTKNVIDALCDDLAKLRVGALPKLIRIRGPERILSALRERVAFLSVDVEYVADDSVEVTIEAEETTIRSALQPWSDLIDPLTR